MAIELVESFFNAVSGFALGLKFEKDERYEPISPLELIAPKTSMLFQNREGETVKEALDRVFQDVEQLVAALVKPVIPPGKMPDRTIPVLERDARWL